MYWDWEKDTKSWSRRTGFTQLEPTTMGLPTKWVQHLGTTCRAANLCCSW